MILSTILTSPTARVYSLRFLLLANIALMALVGLALQGDDHRYPPSYFAFSCSIVICVHHVLGVFNWPMRGLALVDLGAVGIEIGVLVSIMAVPLWTPCISGGG
ncbi:hypothetical protein B0H14DRAFT_2704845, partial [Mycena olivaceomarginata]